MAIDPNAFYVNMWGIGKGGGDATVCDAQVFGSLKAAGYAGVEAFVGDEAYARALTKHGLKLCAAHTVTRTLAEPAPIKAFLDAADCNHINVSGPLTWNERGIDEYKATAAFLNKHAARLKDDGVAVHYHNHDFEFEPIDGARTGMDVLLDDLDPDLVDLCIDTGWVWYAGVDAAAFLRKHGARIGMIHIRDFRAATKDGSCALGEGAIDLDAHLAAINALPAMQLFVVEQDPAPGDDETAVAKAGVAEQVVSIEYLKSKT